MNRIFHISFICLILFTSLCNAQNVQCNATTLEDFLQCYGGPSVFSEHSIEAITAFIEAEDAIENGEFTEAKILVDNIFETYPRGSNIWWNVFNAPNGANIGTPHAYYGLRMMEDIIDHGINGDPNIQTETVNMKIVLIGCSEGIQPTTDEEMNNGTGTFITNSIDPKIKENDYRVAKQSIELFAKYVTAITAGKLVLNIEFIEVDNFCLPVSVTTTLPRLAYNGINPVWNEISDEIKEDTDWWLIMYPSHVPEFPDFDDDAFITGGMGADDKGGPVFIADDKWIVRKPAHLGAGNYSDIERRIYLPQWFQHEFFHHLFRLYPELQLEVNGHDWFDINFWPSDFEGQFETDFYSEALHKRLQIDCIPISKKLITRNTIDLGTEFSKLSMDELLGPYSLDIVQNPWHEGNIIFENGDYFWRNNANVQWKVTPTLLDGKLVTGSDSPYPGEDFHIQLYQSTDGIYYPGALALKYQNELYKKRFDLIDDKFPIEISLGKFERVPNEEPAHIGNIDKLIGEFSWINNSGESWILTPNSLDKSFEHNSDSPTPDEKFQLIMVETGCDNFVLGFKYVDHYFWKPKRNNADLSPILVNNLADVVLEENFGNFTIDLSSLFLDPENEDLLLFTTSENSSLISANIIGKELTLSGAVPVDTRIFVMALDTNGGLAIDEFNVIVKKIVSVNEAVSSFGKIRVYPSHTSDFVYFNGIPANFEISMFSNENAYQKTILNQGEKTQIDMSQMPSGMYFIKIINPENAYSKVYKIVKY